MEPRLTRGEYWLLETAVKSYYPLRWLDSDDPGLLFNKPGHGLDRDRLVATLGALFRDELIEASRNDEWCVLDELQIRNALTEQPPLKNPSCTRYRLTKRGAATWEAFAAPEWDRFILDESPFSENENETYSEPRSGSATRS